jgi:hypothetical protein
MIFSPAALAAAAAILPPLSPTIGHFLGIRSKDYRTYEVTLSVSNSLGLVRSFLTALISLTSKPYAHRVYLRAVNAAALPMQAALAAAGTKECSLCCNSPAFAIEYASNAPGIHWAPLRTKPDKHGVPLVYHAANHSVTLTLVIEPPWKPAAVRHAWQDAPQCMLFGQPGGMPVPPFNITSAG